jgi:hypothetical protein
VSSSEIAMATTDSACQAESRFMDSLDGAIAESADGLLVDAEPRLRYLLGLQRHAASRARASLLVQG